MTCLIFLHRFVIDGLRQKQTAITGYLYPYATCISLPLFIVITSPRFPYPVCDVMVIGFCNNNNNNTCNKFIYINGQKRAVTFFKSLIAHFITVFHKQPSERTGHCIIHKCRSTFLTDVFEK